MKNALRVLTFVGIAFLFGTGDAQETRTPITADNATELTPQYSIGSALPGKLAFSPDGRRIAIGTSEQTFVYDAIEFEDPPVIFPFNDFEFNAAGELIAEGKRWNIRTGLSTGVAAAVHVYPPTSEQPNTVVEIVKPGGETIRVDTGFPYPVVATAVNDTYSLAAVAMRPEHPLYGDPTVYLYALPSGRLSAAFPQVSPVVRNFFFIAGTLISDFWQPQAAAGSVSLYNTPYRVPEHAKSYSAAGVRRSPDGKIVLFESDQQMLVVFGEGLYRQFPYSPETNPNPDEYDYYPPPHTLGNRHVAIATHGFIEIFDLQSVAEPMRIPVDDEEISMYSFLLIDDDRKLLLKTTPPRILNLEQPDAPPVELNIDGGYFYSINDDATRYTVGLGEGQLSVRNVENGETLADLPNGTVINASYLQAVYWAGGRAIVHNLITDQNKELEIIDGYLGKVAGIHAPTGIGVFAGQSVTLANLEAKAVETIDTPFVPDGVDFTEDGSLMLMNRQFQNTPREHPALAIWDIEAEMAVSFEGGDELWHISNTGKYISRANDSCRWYEDGGPVASLHHADVLKFESLVPLFHVSGGCLDKVFGYAPNDDIVYTGLFSELYAISAEQLDTSTGPFSFEYMRPILSYGRTDGPNFEVIMGVVVSPDGNLIGVLLRTGSIDDSDLSPSYRTEIFTVESLQTRVRRIDVSPLLTIEGATTATFSPDSAFVATNAGAFSVKSRKLLNTDATISAFTIDSRFLATYENGNIVIWHIAEAYSNPYPLAQYEVAGVRELGFSSDGTSLYVVRDGDIQVWQVDER